MTSNTTGTQWLTQSSNQPSAYIFKQPTRPPLRHPSTSGATKSPSRCDAGPAFKKQKLDHEHGSFAPSLVSHVQYTSFTANHEARKQNAHLSSEQTSNASHQSFTSRPRIPSAPSLLFPLRSSSDQRQDRGQSRSSAAHRNASKPGGVQIKPFVPEIPSPAPRYPPSGRPGRVPDSAHSVGGEEAADFSPWKGNHAEDVLSESSTKNGFYDKIQISQTESSTGRSSVWSSLRHKSGLQVLSSLFVSVLDQRQVHGTVTAGCTFKPPPRVTLTDSKREAWLQDLANPNIPLRRLSRTIPHGVRGRALLEQSLAKNIPTARSLWLAKCVGANEIRAFKRKGASGAFAVGGEMKWIRDWTANVEQFLDAIVASCGSSEWKDNMAYG